MIVNDKVDGRMLRIIKSYYNVKGFEMRYMPLTNILVFEWAGKSPAPYSKCVCRLDAWFTEAAQNYIIDMIMPRL